MREILFKARTNYDGKWVEGYYCKWLRGERIITYSEKETDCIITWMSNGGMSRYEVDPETLCQFTGLIDKNGKRIWENDIVEAWSQGSRAIGTVKQRVDGLWIMSPAWQNHEFWELKPNGNGETTVEVLGNAFDNPELLQEESNE